jgi:NAD(P)H dehydrogenase (quinone)
MHAVIVVAHPEPASFTHAVAVQIIGGIDESGDGNSSEIADLAAESFDPRFTADDFAVHRREMPPPADVAGEQARIDRADSLVLVYPVFWWSMPGLLKGWVDRVFTNGWAYEEGPNIHFQKKLRHLQVHLVAVGGASLKTYARHGYFGAMRTQIDHGIFDYCGATVVRSELLHDSDDHNPKARLDLARDVGRGMFMNRKSN